VQSHFRVEVSQNGRTAVISLAGELDLASSPELEEKLARLEESEPTVLVIDLRELAFMDSTGLSVLVRAHKKAQERGQRFGLVRGSHQVQRLLTLTGVAERFTVIERPEEMLEEA
jgi:anti-anti-sigma factor